MSIFREILVPLDGSAAGWQALSQAIEVAKADGSFVRGMYVVDVRRLSETQAYFQTPYGLALSPYVRTDSELENWYLKWGSIVLHTMEEDCRQQGITSVGIIRRGFSERVICQDARLADLVIFGHLRRKGMRHRGSMLETVIRKGTTPVLVTFGKASQLRRILLIYDRPREDSRALHVAACFSQKYGLPLTVLVASHKLTEYVEKTLRLESYLKPYSVETEFLAGDGGRTSSVISAVKSKRVDTIFAGRYRHDALFTTVMGSTLDSLIDEAPCPVLICP